MYKGTVTENDQIYHVAVKTLSPTGTIKRNDWMDLQRESRLLKQLRHDNIVKIIDISYEDPFLIVMELVDGSSLSLLLKTDAPNLTTKKLLFFSEEIAKVSNTPSWIVIFTHIYLFDFFPTGYGLPAKCKYHSSRSSDS